MNMKNLLPFAVLPLIAACSTLPDGTIYAGSNETTCATQKAEERGQTHTMKWCVSRKFLLPNVHTIELNGKRVFGNRDDKPIEFKIASEMGELIGSCASTVAINDMKTSKPALVSTLPKEVVQRCKIESTADGLSKPFVRTPECEEVYYKGLGPMIGTIFPRDIRRECTVKRGSDTPFKFDILLP